MCLAIIVIFGFSNLVFAGGWITGGTTNDTTDKQRQHTQKKVNNQQHMSISPKAKMAIDIGHEVITNVFPKVEAAEKLLKVGIWAGEKQREAGGITGTTGAINNIKK